jgi:hypothetical protein
MATAFGALSLLSSLVTQAVQGVLVGGQPPVVGVGWPNVNALQDVGRTRTALVNIYNRRAQRTTRWPPMLMAPPPSVGVTIAPASLEVPAGGTATVTLGGSPLANDAVGLTVTHLLQVSGATVTEAQAVSPSQFASDLATAVNATAPVSSWLAASASGAVVTLRSLGPAVSVATAAGTQVSAFIEVARELRHCSIHVWTARELDREAVGDPIVASLAQLTSQFGAQFPDGTWARVRYEGDLYVEDDLFKDLYRRDLFVDLEYGITTTELLYSVLVPIPQWQIDEVELGISNLVIS